MGIQGLPRGAGRQLRYLGAAVLGGVPSGELGARQGGILHQNLGGGVFPVALHLVFSAGAGDTAVGIEDGIGVCTARPGIGTVEVHIRLCQPTLQKHRVRQGAVVGPKADGEEELALGGSFDHRRAEPAALVHPGCPAIVGEAGQGIELPLIQAQAVTGDEGIQGFLYAQQMIPKGFLCLLPGDGIAGAGGGAVADAPLAAADISLGPEALMLFDEVHQVLAGRHLGCRTGRKCQPRKHRHDHDCCQQGI